MDGWMDGWMQEISSTVVVTKVGVWGGEGGSAQDIATTEPPRRLQSLTVRAGVAVDSIEFTYSTDTGGQTRTAGRWGGLGGNVRKVSDLIGFPCTVPSTASLAMNLCSRDDDRELLMNIYIYEHKHACVRAARSWRR
jgi:hypothetical protein